jgi:purine nucleoside phosphorylase
MGYAAVGMSTAPEMARAHALGMNSAAISCITNNCTKIQTLTHDHVVDTASHASAALCGILRNAIQQPTGPKSEHD